jgi:hypothetical protein
MAIHMKILINKVENIIHNNDIKLKLFEIIIHAPHTKLYIYIYNVAFPTSEIDFILKENKCDDVVNNNKTMHKVTHSLTL